MKQWTEKDLDALGAAGELEISSRRADGTLSPPVTIWAVRHDNNVHVRWVNCRSATWYSAAKRRAAGRISSGGVERDVQFLDPEGNVEDAIDNAYRNKYGASSGATQQSSAHWPATPRSGSRPLIPRETFPAVQRRSTMSSNQHSGRVAVITGASSGIGEATAARASPHRARRRRHPDQQRRHLTPRRCPP